MIEVLLCSRNGERYIREQAESILAPEGPELRLRVSDDCSTDGTIGIVRELAEHFPGRVSFVRRSEPTGGAARHFLTALRETDLSEARYVMLSDQDDVWHPDKAGKTLSAMLEAEKTCGSDTPLLVHCDMRVVDEALGEIAPSYARYQKMSPERTKLCQLLVQNNVTGGALMANTALLKLVKEKPVPEHALMHDHWLALIAAAFGRIVYIDEALYDYRQHGANVLGAEKGGMLREVLGRLGLFRKDGLTKADMDERSGRVYAALFSQAAEFGKLYRDELSEKDLGTLQAFLRLRLQSRPVKIFNILRYGFTFNRLHRTAGECLFL